jgi:hypothetical protein
MSSQWWVDYCLEWCAALGGVAFVWPLIGVCIDIITLERS